ncbi:AzlD domain-containing protein [uncultured Ilyobacter sp.]|uniref:AzlD domain-containing protein n=1 Tax=uncultured Ilyobacter sp. TaxID=544433 RepID=UPI0029F5A820|nr:AzlD domain-containing protein [uncultured Ilyobacter sp.]
MEIKFLMVILGSMFINYFLRAVPVLCHTGKKPGRFLKSFLEYIPFAAIGALLFPDVLYSTDTMWISVAGLMFAGGLILLKKNMLLVVSATIFLVYILNIVKP